MLQEAGQAVTGASRGGEELKGAHVSSQLKGAHGLTDEVQDERIGGGGEALSGGEELKGAAEVKDERIVIVVTVVYNNVIMLQKQVLKCSCALKSSSVRSCAPLSWLLLMCARLRSFAL